MCECKYASKNALATVSLLYLSEEGKDLYILQRPMLTSVYAFDLLFAANSLLTELDQHRMFANVNFRGVIDYVQSIFPIP